MMMGIGEFSLEQKDGNLPTTLAAGSAPGESGVSVLSVRFQGSAHFNAKPQKHLIWFRMTPEMRFDSPQVRFECRIAARTLCHEPPKGSLAIVPAGLDCGGDAEESVNATIIAIDPAHFALAAAENSAVGANLIERLYGYDQALLDRARTLALESANGYPNGPLFWNEIASEIIAGLIVRHSSKSDSRARGSLGKDVLDRLRDYIMAHLGEPIEVATLAKVAGCSPFHFTRVFARSVGVTPHRYIVHLRLQRAIELVRQGQSSLAEIADDTGFADQSHLARWARRVHGVSLTHFVVSDKTGISRRPRTRERTKAL